MSRLEDIQGTDMHPDRKRYEFMVLVNKSDFPLRFRTTERLITSHTIEDIEADGGTIVLLKVKTSKALNVREFITKMNIFDSDENIVGWWATKYEDFFTILETGDAQPVLEEVQNINDI